jgi:hypothetical protein
MTDNIDYNVPDTIEQNKLDNIEQNKSDTIEQNKSDNIEQNKPDNINIPDKKISRWSPLVYKNTNPLDTYTSAYLIDAEILDATTFYNSPNDTTLAILYNNFSSREDLTKLLSELTNVKRLAIIFDTKNIDKKIFLNNELFHTNSDLLDTPNKSDNFTFLKNLPYIKQLDFLCCNTLNNNNWKKFYSLLPYKIGASNDETGNILSGGDWIMENTNEDIQNIYFNNNISNYHSTLIYTFPTPQITISNNITINSWPTFTTGTYAYLIKGTSPITVTLGSGLIVSDLRHYFVIGSDKVTIDGNNNPILINCAEYGGLIRNGDGENYRGYNYITVKNITTSMNSTGYLRNNAGYIGGYCFGVNCKFNRFENCINNIRLLNNKDGCGGIVGGNATCTVYKCTNNGQIYSTGSGGIFGSALNSLDGASKSIAKYCINTGDIYFSYACGGIFGGSVAGYYGQNSSVGANNCIAINCVNRGRIISSKACGGIYGGGFSTSFTSYTNAISASKCNAIKCTNYGNFINQNPACVGCGGIFGGMVNEHFYSNPNNPDIDTYNINGDVFGYNNCNAYLCNNLGNIADNISCGGIFGGSFIDLKPGTTGKINIELIQYNDLHIYPNLHCGAMLCNNSGDMSNTYSCGGIFGGGYVKSANVVGASNCPQYGYGNVQGAKCIIYLSNNSLAKYCSNNGNMTQSYNCGGIYGGGYSLGGNGTGGYGRFGLTFGGNGIAGEAIVYSFIDCKAIGCYNNGNMSDNNCGGIFGGMYKQNGVSINDDGTGIGGTATAYGSTNSLVYNSYNTGSLNTTSYGIFGTGSVLCKAYHCYVSSMAIPSQNPIYDDTQSETTVQSVLIVNCSLASEAIGWIDNYADKYLVEVGTHKKSIWTKNKSQKNFPYYLTEFDADFYKCNKTYINPKWSIEQEPIYNIISINNKSPKCYNIKINNKTGRIKICDKQDKDKKYIIQVVQLFTNSNTYNINTLCIKNN